MSNILDGVFSQCTSLTSITCLATDPPDLGSGNNLPSVKNVYVPAGSVNAYKAATNWASYGDKIDSIQ